MDHDTLDRERLAKIIGMLSSTADGERSAALAAADRALVDAGLTWIDVAALMENLHLHLPAREALLARLVGDRLDLGLRHSWAMGPGEATMVRLIQTALLENGSLSVPAEDMAKAIAAADSARQKAGDMPSVRKLSNWR